MRDRCLHVLLYLYGCKYNSKIAKKRGSALILVNKVEKGDKFAMSFFAKSKARY